MRRTPIAGSLIGLSVAAASVVSCSKTPEKTRQDESPSKRPNIVLITIESLRSDHVGCYGYPRPTTPALDALATEATVFENAYSTTSWTLASHAAIFTGLYPSAANVVLATDKLKDCYMTLAEQLSDSGYQTAAIVSGDYLRSTFGLNQGFQFYDESPISEPSMDPHQDVTNPRMEARLNHFLNDVRRKDKPFFLFLYYWDTHYQYIPPPPYNETFVSAGAEVIKNPPFDRTCELGRNVSASQLEYLKSQYDGEIRCTDTYLKKLLDQLRAMGIWDDTVIVLTADHGEQFFEHGRLGHKFDVHVESLHVPLIVRLPGDKTAKRDPRLVSLIDIFPTVLELAGCSSLQTGHCVSLLGKPRSATSPIFHELKEILQVTAKDTGQKGTKDEEWYAVRLGAHKLIWRMQQMIAIGDTILWTPQVVLDAKQTFNIAIDPREERPVEIGQVEQTARMLTEIDNWRAAMKIVADKGGAPSKAVLTPEEEQRLRSLGYLR